MCMGECKSPPTQPGDTESSKTPLREVVPAIAVGRPPLQPGTDLRSLPSRPGSAKKRAASTEHAPSLALQPTSSASPGPAVEFTDTRRSPRTALAVPAPRAHSAPRPGTVETIVVREQDFRRHRGDLEKLRQCQVAPWVDPPKQLSNREQFEENCRRPVELRDPWRGIANPELTRAAHENDSLVNEVWVGRLEHQSGTSTPLSEPEPANANRCVPYDRADLKRHRERRDRLRNTASVALKTSCWSVTSRTSSVEPLPPPPQKPPRLEERGRLRGDPAGSREVAPEGPLLGRPPRLDSSRRPGSGSPHQPLGSEEMLSSSCVLPGYRNNAEGKGGRVAERSPSPRRSPGAHADEGPSRARTPSTRTNSVHVLPPLHPDGIYSLERSPLPARRFAGQIRCGHPPTAVASTAQDGEVDERLASISGCSITTAVGVAHGGDAEGVASVGAATSVAATENKEGVGSRVFSHTRSSSQRLRPRARLSVRRSVPSIWH